MEAATTDLDLDLRRLRQPPFPLCYWRCAASCALMPASRTTATPLLPPALTSWEFGSPPAPTAARSSTTPPRRARHPGHSCRPWGLARRLAMAMCPPGGTQGGVLWVGCPSADGHRPLPLWIRQRPPPSDSLPLELKPSRHHSSTLDSLSSVPDSGKGHPSCCQRPVVERLEEFGRSFFLMGRYPEVQGDRGGCPM